MYSIVRSMSELDVLSLQLSSSGMSCPGLLFQWHVPEKMNIQMNIPWARTLSGASDELPFMINLVDGLCYARSPACIRVTHFNGSCCLPCAGLTVRVSELGTTIMTYKSRTRRSLLNVVQLHQVLDDRNSELNKWKFKVMF